MKFDCGLLLNYDEWIADREKWHRWFAWYPVRVGLRECRWFEMVARKGTRHEGASYVWWTWEYGHKGFKEGIKK